MMASDAETVQFPPKGLRNAANVTAGSSFEARPIQSAARRCRRPFLTQCSIRSVQGRGRPLLFRTGTLVATGRCHRPAGHRVRIRSGARGPCRSGGSDPDRRLSRCKPPFRRVLVRPFGTAADTPAACGRTGQRSDFRPIGRGSNPGPWSTRPRRLLEGEP
jgi:hypothetical protein